MKLQESANRLETNVENRESRKFSINNAEKIIMILRDKMYETKEQTLTQEYICNARDAMREVGKGNGFEITVPTRLNPLLSIRDFGPGMSPERINNVFTYYGDSTKTDSNVQTGGFGIGGKSAWSYTDSFTIVTYIDGVKRTYLAHTGNNSGAIDLMKTETTDEENGTEVQIAVRPDDVREFERAVSRAIYFWKDKPTVKGMEVPTLVQGTMVSDHIEIIDRNALPSYVSGGDDYDNRPLCVIDGIPYPVTEKLLQKCPKLNKARQIPRRRLVLHFGTGIVELGASRESISDSPFTVNALERMGTKVMLELKTFIQSGFAKVQTAGDYVSTYLEMSKDFHLEGGFIKYGEYEMKGTMLVNPLLKKVKMTVIHCTGKYGRRVEKITKQELSEIRREIDIAHFPHTFYLKATETPVVQNKRVREYHKNTTHLLLLEPLNGDMASLDQVIKELQIKDFQSITYTEVPKEQRAKVTRGKTEFCMHCPGYGLDRHTYTTLDDNIQKWLYVQVNDGDWEVKGDLRELDSYLRQKGLRICGLAPRAAKMVEGNKNFKPLKEWLDNFTPTDCDVKAIAHSEARNGGVIGVLSGLKGLKDPFLTEMVKEYKAIGESDKRVAMPEVMKIKVRQSKEYKAFKEKDEKLAKLISKQYPLAYEVEHYSRHVGELAFYINAKYEANE